MRRAGDVPEVGYPYTPTAGQLVSAPPLPQSVAPRPRALYLGTRAPAAQSTNASTIPLPFRSSPQCRKASDRPSPRPAELPDTAPSPRPRSYAVAERHAPTLPSTPVPPGVRVSGPDYLSAVSLFLGFYPRPSLAASSAPRAGKGRRRILCTGSRVDVAYRAGRTQPHATGRSCGAFSGCPCPVPESTGEAAAASPGPTRGPGGRRGEVVF